MSDYSFDLKPLFWLLLCAGALIGGCTVGVCEVVAKHVHIEVTTK